MSRNLRISRRAVLRGLGTAIALPWLEAMAPLYSIGAAPAPETLKRLAFIYVPNGILMSDWTPNKEGDKFELPSILEPLKPFQKEMLVLSGLCCDKARAHGDGGGDHARAMSAFLTGCQPRKTNGADIKAGISVDQVAAQKLGRLTRFPSLEIGCEPGHQTGSCDSGYSCAYVHNLSWKSETTPMSKEIDPSALFDRLFAGSAKGDGDKARGERERYNKSVLDFALEDANRLKGKLGATDRQKLDEYLGSVREIEQRVDRGKQENVKTPIGATRPSGIPKEYQTHLRLMADLLILAFQGDLTRIATFVFSREASNRSYNCINISEGHHELSHHQGDKEKMGKVRSINLFHVNQLAYMLGRLKSIKEGDSTLLDNSMIVYGSGHSDGSHHSHENLPILLLGKGSGTLKPGRHVRYPKETPVTNLFLAMLERMGVPTPKLGDSTGKLERL